MPSALFVRKQRWKRYVHTYSWRQKSKKERDCEIGQWVNLARSTERKINGIDGIEK